MLVKDWMTKEVVSVSPDTSMMKASRIMKDRHVRRLPVVDEERRVVGIVSDRDIRDASPSKATTLDMHELYYLLSELKIKDIMTKNPVCAEENDSVEAVALTMQERRFGGMPVIDAEQRLVGIITESDIFRVLISITGIRTGGMQMAFELENRPGTLRPILDILRAHGAHVVSLLTAEKEDGAVNQVYIRLQRMPHEAEDAVLAELRGSSKVLYHEYGLARRQQSGDTPAE